MTDEIYVRRVCKSHFLVGYCIKSHVKMHFEAKSLIISEAVFLLNRNSTASLALCDIYRGYL